MQIKRPNFAELKRLGQCALPIRFCAFGLVIALLVLPDSVAAQSGFSFGADNQGAPIVRPGFGDAGLTDKNDRPEPGTVGRGDYAAFLGRLSIIEPAMDVGGLWTVFRVTQLLCNALHTGEASLAEVAPKGFVLARADIHELGFGGDNWNKDWYAITVTGDAEKDEAAGHPIWRVKYGEDGRLSSCGVSIGSPSANQDSDADEAAREGAIRFMYTGLPQSLFGIITEPRFAGLYPLSPFEAIEMATPCGGSWCRISTIYNFQPDYWQVSSTINFGLAVKAE